MSSSESVFLGTSSGSKRFARHAALERLERGSGRGEGVCDSYCSEGKRMNSVEDLDVFKLAHELALKAYSATKGFPKEV